MVARNAVFLPLALTLAACGAEYPSLDEPLPPPRAKPPAARATAAKASPALAAGEGSPTLRRADVERVVDAGLGRFLAHVAVEPSLSGGRFVGWTIVGLSPSELWQGVDLRPGDVVSRINGMAIEREMEAFDVFQAVRQAPTLEISYFRQNQARTLRFDIIGAPSPALPKTPPAADGASAAQPPS